MKKLIATLLLLTLAIGMMFSCTPKDDTTIRVGYMSGPTGMGMAKLIHDNGGLENGNEKYSFKKYQDTVTATADLSAGNVDIICLPTNDAAKYYTATNKNAVVLSINCLGTLYLITDGNTTVNAFSELEGKTVYTCKNGTPKIILEALLRMTGVNATVMTEKDGQVIATPNDLATLAIAGKVDIAVIPEPIVTNVTVKNSSYSVDLNLSKVWDDSSETPLAMGCVVASRDFVNNHKGIVDAFLKEYKNSIEFINAEQNVETSAKYVVEAGIMQAEAPAKKALNNLRGSIAYIDGKNMKNALVDFYEAIGVNLIGGALPLDEFYYEK